MKYIKGFDSLRAISILMVALSHLSFYSDEFCYTRPWIVVSGTTGVQIFFTLSGFLITSLLLKEIIKTGRINFKNFFARRFIRLLPPLVLFYTLVGFFMLEGSISSTWVGFLFSVFYAYNFVPHQYYTVELGHTWSLGVEEQFYITWPFILNTLKKINTLSIVTFSFLTLCILAYFIFPDMGLSKNYHTDRWFIPAAAPIIVGSYFAILNHFYAFKWKEKITNNYLPIAIGIALFIYPLYSLDILLKLAPIFQSMGISFLLLWLIYNQESKITQVIDNRLFRYIGQISYGIYVYQGFFFRTGPGGELAVQHYPLNVIMVLIIAILSYEFYEKPILKWKKRFV